MDQIEVPSYYLCPISLQIMRDPVTLSTGITYDRSSIEKWLFSYAKSVVCPVTKQLLTKFGENAGDVVITPNHTLRRLIQAWCTLNASHGIERFPTPKPPASRQQISKLLTDAFKNSENLSHCLQTFRSMVGDSDANKRTMKASGVVEFLRSVIVSKSSTCDNDTVCCQAVYLLYNLEMDEGKLKGLLGESSNGFIDSLVKILQREHDEARTYTVLLLKSLISVADPEFLLVSMTPEFFQEIVRVLRDDISATVSKAALQTLVYVSLWGWNRVKAAQAGAVSTLLEILLSTSNNKRRYEMALMALEQVCKCAEGREGLVSHGAGLAAVSGKVLRVSPLASQSGVRVLLMVARHLAGNKRVLQEMLEVGVVKKLCLVMQVGGGSTGDGRVMVEIKEMAKEILKLHFKTWNNSPCFPPSLFLSI